MKFTVKDRHIKHDGRLYAPDDSIELTSEEAERLGDSVEPVRGSGAAHVDAGEKKGIKRVK